MRLLTDVLLSWHDRVAAVPGAPGSDSLDNA